MQDGPCERVVARVAIVEGEDDGAVGNGDPAAADVEEFVHAEGGVTAIAKMTHLGGKGVVIGRVNRLVVGNAARLDLPACDQAVVQKDRDAIPPVLEVHRAQHLREQCGGYEVEDDHTERRHHDRSTDRSLNGRAPTA